MTECIYVYHMGESTCGDQKGALDSLELGTGPSLDPQEEQEVFLTAQSSLLSSFFLLSFFSLTRMYVSISMNRVTFPQLYTLCTDEIQHP